MAKQTLNLGKRWYVLHTYSGLEEAVEHNLKQRIESMDMEDKIFGVLIPKEKKIRIKNGKRKIVEEKIYPGYVLVQMLVTDESWYVVRNTPRVTGFLGAGTTPISVSKKDIDDLMGKIEKDVAEFTIDVVIGDIVKIADGPFKGFEGKVSEIDQARGKIKVLVNMFGRDTPVELDSLQIQQVG